MSYCTRFPVAEFGALLASGDFDIRWPLTFAAWYWGATSATVDEACAKFITAAGLWDEASGVLSEYEGPDPDWLFAWRKRFEACRPKQLTTKSGCSGFAWYTVTPAAPATKLDRSGQNQPERGGSRASP
jgi:hypothetical protein